jgi:hypothetical protein
MGAAVGKWDARSADELGDGPREEDFVGLGVRLDSLGDVDGDAADVVAILLDLAGVETDPHVDADAAHAVADGTGAAHRSPGPSKVARNPSPVVRISRPRKRSSSARVRPSWVASSSDHRRSPMSATWGRGTHYVSEQHRLWGNRKWLKSVTPG